jgi:electron transport complex protein RnfD
LITGVLLAFNVPSNLPVWIIVIGALVAIGIGKMSFGGLGCNIFNPALVGRVFLLISLQTALDKTLASVLGYVTSFFS